MLNIIKNDLDNYPKTFINKDKEIFLITKDHCKFLRIIALRQGGRIFSAEYSSIDEILKEYEDFKEVNTKLIIEGEVKTFVR
ncbi:TPA: hypothetical protein N2D99_002306 [Clostridium botulinum]|nr:hypothetical protein [Clostridium botulinum]